MSKDMSKDKNKIWTDCPECAYKHLTAAYALASDPTMEKYPTPASDVLLARAWVAFCESRNGYPGNLALAEGCLAAAENLVTGMTSGLLRTIRLSKGDHLQWERVFSCYLISASNGVRHDPRWVLAKGHICEALRECPALIEDFPTLDEADPDTLAEAVHWVKTTYELGGNNDWIE